MGGRERSEWPMRESIVYVEDSGMRSLKGQLRPEPGGNLTRAEKSCFIWWGVRNHGRIFFNNFIEVLLTYNNPYISKYTIC